MQTTRLETSTGEFVNILPKGTRIRHIKHPELTGVIRSHEYHESGKISPIPYGVEWDNRYLARELLGSVLNIWQSEKSVEHAPHKRGR